MTDVKTHFFGDDCEPDGHRTDMQEAYGYWHTPDGRTWEDDDLTNVFMFANDKGLIDVSRRVYFKREDVSGIVAEVPGQADGPDWCWVVKMNENSYGKTRYVYISAGCDYTGWYCQAGVSDAFDGYDLDGLLDDIPNGDRKIRDQLKAQVAGTQPFGTDFSGVKPD